MYERIAVAATAVAAPAAPMYALRFRASPSERIPSYVGRLAAASVPSGRSIASASEYFPRAWPPCQMANPPSTTASPAVPTGLHLSIWADLVPVAWGGAAGPIAIGFGAAFAGSGRVMTRVDGSPVWRNPASAVSDFS